MTVIALTREIGSLGTEVAAGVAKKLGLKNIHSEIVAPSVAQRLGVAEDTVLRHVDGSPSLLDRWQVDRRKLSRYTSEEIMGLAQHGKVLIHSTQGPQSDSLQELSLRLVRIHPELIET